MAEGWRAPIDDAAAALVFLTRVPVPWTIPGFEARLPRATPWFPVIGVLVGAVGALAWWAGDVLLGPWPAAIAAVAATVLVTGAFHEDGLADTFDGLGASPVRGQALEIMKDSRLGSYGALALVLVLLARIAALAGLGAAAPAALVGAHALARCAALPLIRWLPYARAEGTGRSFAGGVTDPGLAAAALFTAAVTGLLWGAAALVVWLLAAAVTLVLAAWFRRRLAGITGDTLGAVNQLVEVTALLVLLALV